MGADVRGGRLQRNARRWMAAAPGGCLVGLLIAALAALLAVQYNLEDLRHRNLSVLTRGHPPGRSQTHQCRAPCTRSQARKSRWTLRAPASRWCWRATTWNKPKPSSPASTGTCSWSCSPRTRHVDWQERWPGIRGTPPAWTGKPSLMWCPGSSVARGWYNGKTGASVTHVAGARRELRESEAASLLFSGRTLIRLTSFTSPDPHRPLPVDRSRLYAGRARAPWRPRLMRASAFQRPQHLVLVPRRRVARWILNLPALPQHKAWQRHRAQSSGAEMREAPPPGGTTGLSRILLVHPHLTAHNLVPPYCHPTEKITRNTSSFPKSVGRSGPNAGGGRLQQVLMWIFLPTTTGVRVSSMAEVEEGPGLCTQFSGKPIGTAPAGGNTRTPHKSAKRSYNRACRRANQSIQAGTWYRGRWHTRAALDSLRIGPNRPQSTPTGRSGVNHDGATGQKIISGSCAGIQGVCLRTFFRNSLPGVTLERQPLPTTPLLLQSRTGERFRTIGVANGYVFTVRATREPLSLTGSRAYCVSSRQEPLRSLGSLNTFRADCCKSVPRT